MEKAVQAQRTRRLLTGIFGGGLGRGFGLVAPIIVMPAMLGYLGDAEFGIWLTAVSLTSMAAFCDLGIGNSLLTKLAAAYGAGDTATMRALIASAYATLATIALVLTIGAVIVVLGLRLVPVMPQALEFVPTVLVTLVAFFAGLPSAVIQRVMYARQQVWLSSLWQMAAALLSILFCLSAIRAALPSWLVILAYSGTPVVMLAVSAVWYFGRYSQLRPTLSDVSRGALGELISTGSRFLLLSLLVSATLNMDNLVIAHNAGVEAVTHYAVPARLGSLMGLMITVIVLPFWAASGEAYARRDFSWIRRSALRISLLGALAVAAVGIFFVLFGDTIMSLWMGQSFVDQQMTLAMLAGLYVVMALTAPYSMVLNARALLDPQVLLWVLMLVFNLIAKFIFVTASAVWMAPMITAIGYALIIFPAVYRFALRR